MLGRRRVFMAGLVLFAGASLACGFAWSEASLITFRCIQGLGGALLSPAALSILVTTFAEGRERNLALGVWGGIAGSGAAAGTLLGGLLTSAFGWQWIFFINVPIGVVLIGLSPVPARAAARTAASGGAVRHSGAVTATAGLMLLVYGLTRATQIGWSSAETITLLVVSAGLLAELRRHRAARAPPRPAAAHPRPGDAADGEHRRAFSSAAAVQSSSSCSRSTCKQVLHYSALKTGVAYVATTFLSVLFGRWSRSRSSIASARASCC